MSSKVAIVVDDGIEVGTIEEVVVDTSRAVRAQHHLAREAVVEACARGRVPENAVAVRREQQRHSDVAVHLCQFYLAATIVQHAVLVLSQPVEAFTDLRRETVSDPVKLLATVADRRIAPGTESAFLKQHLSGGILYADSSRRKFDRCGDAAVPQAGVSAGFAEGRGRPAARVQNPRLGTRDTAADSRPCRYVEDAFSARINLYCLFRASRQKSTMTGLGLHRGWCIRLSMKLYRTKEGKQESAPEHEQSSGMDRSRQAKASRKRERSIEHTGNRRQREAATHPSRRPRLQRLIPDIGLQPERVRLWSAATALCVWTAALAALQPHDRRSTSSTGSTIGSPGSGLG